MARPSIIWLTTDTHFNHNILVKGGYRPAGFESLIIKNLRHNVAEQDILIHLGDVIFYQYPYLNTLMDQIPGKKILVMGNHDHKSRGWYIRNGFDYATDMLVQDNVLFSHRPQPDLPPWIKLNIHGHLHTSNHRPKERKLATGDKYHLISLEENDYMPVNLATILNTKGD